MPLIALVTLVKNKWPCGWARPNKHYFGKPKNTPPERSFFFPKRWRERANGGRWTHTSLAPCSTVLPEFILVPTKKRITEHWDWLRTGRPRREPSEGRFRRPKAFHFCLSLRLNKQTHRSLYLPPKESTEVLRRSYTNALSKGRPHRKQAHRTACRILFPPTWMLQ